MYWLGPHSDIQPRSRTHSQTGTLGVANLEYGIQKESAETGKYIDSLDSNSRTLGTFLTCAGSQASDDSPIGKSVNSNVAELLRLGVTAH